MNELVEFVKARIAEDRAIAEAATSDRWAADTLRAVWPMREAVAEHIARQDPAVTLARCDALDGLAEYLGRVRRYTWGSPVYEVTVEALLLLAAVWASHPDYRQEWVKDES